ncbi:MAG: histidine kinase [Rhodobacterales bacterium]|nr:MAG: histidine kinase [Rhodobacterales bacterium]
MTAAHKIDVTDLGSVRNAARRSGVVVGDDWVSPDGAAERELQDRRRRRSFLTLNKSPIARKIITFNLLALVVLVAGVLYLNPSRDNLIGQRARGLSAEAELVADVFEAQLPAGGSVNLATAEGVDAVATLQALDLRGGSTVTVFDPEGILIGAASGGQVVLPELGSTLITDFFNTVWEQASRLLSRNAQVSAGGETDLEAIARAALSGPTTVDTGQNGSGAIILTVGTPILHAGAPVGAVVLSSAAGEIDGLVRQERELLFKMFVLGILVSIGLSLVLASTIANPLSDLAAAAELGREKNARKMAPARVRIPDLTGRPDEIGRLSGALRGMVAALYDRIEVNEQFAADVAHEIKNPLASLRSAVGTLRNAKREDHRVRLLEVIEHDVQRLDRLVSDISNASRLDSELVKEEEATFNLMTMLGNLNSYLGQQAKEQRIDYITDLPDEVIEISGLEGRLAQVFVNLITNAMSFCEDGDAIRVWARRRDNRVIVVVEDTGPGIPEAALTKIFRRFYSHRPAGQFGNNSGLGLAISKQIVEAHGGVIWAENIRPTEADVTSEPLGARFVVGLPL